MLVAKSSSDPLIDRYFLEVSRHPLPTRDEEIANFTAYRSARLAANLASSVADREALSAKAEALAKKIACGYLRFVVDRAKKRTRSPELMLELVSEGNVGLMRAIVKFEPSFQVRFLTYANNWINVHIQEHLYRLKVVNVPSHTRKESKKKRIPLDDLAFAPIENVMVASDVNVSDDVISKNIDALAILAQAQLTPLEKLVLIYTYGLRGGEPLEPEAVSQVIYGIDGTQMTRAKYDEAHTRALVALKTHLGEENIHALSDILA